MRGVYRKAQVNSDATDAIDVVKQVKQAGEE